MAKGAFNFNNLLVALRNFFTSTGVTAGIDMGSSALKIIELKKTKAGYTLNDFIFAPIPPAVRLDEIQRNQFIINSLKEARRDGKIRSLGAYVLLSGSEVNIICVTIPKLKQSDFQKALLLEIKKQIAFEPNTAFYAYQVAFEIPDRAGPKQQLVVAVAQRKAVEAKIDILRKAGLQTAGISILPNVLGGILCKGVKPNPDEITCVIELGAKLSHFSVLKGDKLEFSREIAIAGDHLTQALVRKVSLPDKEINITLEQAEKIKLECGIPAKEELETSIEGLTRSYILAMLRPTLERLATEVLRSLNYYLQSFKRPKIDRIFLSGGSSRLKNLDDFLSKNLKDMVVERLDPLGVISGWNEPMVANQGFLEELAVQMSVALGLAMGKRAGTADLIPPEIIIQKRLSKVETILKIITPTITAGIIFFYFLISMQTLHYRRLIAQVEATVKSFGSTKELILEYDALKEKMEQRQSLLNKAVGRQPLWWGVLKELGWIRTEGVTLEKLAVIKQEGEPLKLKLEGEITPTYTTIDLALSQYLVQLDESPFFEDVKLVSTARDIYSQTPKAKFEIILRLVY